MAIHKNVFIPLDTKQESNIPNPIQNNANPITRFIAITILPAYSLYYAGKEIRCNVVFLMIPYAFYHNYSISVVSEAIVSFEKNDVILSTASGTISNTFVIAS